MRNYRVPYLLMICGLAGCGHASERRLVCILPGYDSVIYCHGSSSNMQEKKRGLVTDKTFMEAMFGTIKENGDSLVMKPGGGAGVLENLKYVYR